MCLSIFLRSYSTANASKTFPGNPAPRTLPGEETVNYSVLNPRNVLRIIFGGRSRNQQASLSQSLRGELVRSLILQLFTHRLPQVLTFHKPFPAQPLFDGTHKI